MLIFGIDPGIGITGYSLVEAQGENLELITSGSIQTNKKAAHPKRLLELKNDLDFLIKTVNSQSKFHILKVKSIKAIIFFDLTKNVMAFLLKNCYDCTVFVGFSRKKDAETQK